MSGKQPSPLINTMLNGRYRIVEQVHETCYLAEDTAQNIECCLFTLEGSPNNVLPIAQKIMGFTTPTLPNITDYFYDEQSRSGYLVIDGLDTVVRQPHDPVKDPDGWEREWDLTINATIAYLENKRTVRQPVSAIYPEMHEEENPTFPYIDDPIAQETDWTLDGEASDYKKHKIVISDPNVFKIEHIKKYRAFGFIFMIIGFSNIFDGGVSTIAGFLFLVIGFRLFRNQLALFNKHSNLLKIGSTSINFDEIYAVQLVSTSTKNRGRYRGELNLILIDSRRINVVCSYHEMRDNAQKLADFLDIPLWDFVDPSTDLE